MSGVFGVASVDDCVDDIYFGTDYHSHLGTRRGGLAVVGDDGVIERKIHNISNAQFRSKFDDDLPNLRGRSGIGVISDTEDQPLLINSRLGSFAIASVCKINNLQEIINSAFASGCSHLSESSCGDPNATEVVACLISRANTMAAGIEYAQRVIDGSCSILILKSNGTLVAARDRYGRTPLMIGKRDGAYAVTMESTAFPTLDYELCYELGPGEIVEITASGYRQLRAPGRTCKICSFFWIYYGFPASTYNGVNAESCRYRNGALMAADDAEVLPRIDSVCGIPDSGVAHALGYAIATNKPYHRAFVKYSPTWARSFMPPNQRLREKVAKMKLIPVYEHIKDKSLLFCDDSIVRGTQMRNTAGRLFRRGAKEVHLRSACPPIAFGCRFLNFSRSRDEMDLAARRAVAKLEGVEKVDAELMKKYLKCGTPEYEAMVEEIRQALGVTTLKFQKLDQMLKAIGLPPEQLCTYCWTGRDVADEEPLME